MPARNRRLLSSLPALATLGLLVLAALLPSALAGQRPQGLLGARLGLSASALATEDDRFVDMTPRKGRVAGVFLESGRGAVAVRPEVVLSQKGGTFDGVHPENTAYVDFSLLVIGRLPELANVHPFLAAGPTLSRCREGCGGGARALDLGGSLGAGLARSVAGVRWTIEGRHDRGFVDYAYAPERERRHRVWSLTAGAAWAVY